MSNSWSSPIPNTVLEDKIERQLEYKNPTYSTLFRFCIATGMMLSDATELLVQDVKGTDRIIIKDFSKHTKNYTVLLDGRTIAMLSELCANKKPNEYVFSAITSPDKINYTTFAKALRSVAKNLGLEHINTMSLRKTHILHLYRTYGIRYVTTLLGKDNITATYDYLGIDRHDAIPNLVCSERVKMLTDDYGNTLIDDIISSLEKMKGIMDKPTTSDSFYVDSYRDLTSIQSTLKTYDALYDYDN